jgi:hypothetical protein
VEGLSGCFAHTGGVAGALPTGDLATGSAPGTHTASPTPPQPRILRRQRSKRRIMGWKNPDAPIVFPDSLISFPNRLNPSPARKERSRRSGEESGRLKLFPDAPDRIPGARISTRGLGKRSSASGKHLGRRVSFLMVRVRSEAAGFFPERSGREKTRWARSKWIRTTKNGSG